MWQNNLHKTNSISDNEQAENTISDNEQALFIIGKKPSL